MANADEHKSNQEEHKARLSRSRQYRTNGYAHIKGNGGKRSRYGDVERIRGVLLKRGTRPRKYSGTRKVIAGSEEHARRYTFVHRGNFKKGTVPYVNQGHHLLPCEALGENYFTADQRELLLRIDYDINNGKNIIFLPGRLRDCEFHNLPQHNGSHPSYTDVVDSDMVKVKRKLDEAMKMDPEHKNYSAKDIRQKLMDLQNQYWKYLTHCGQIPINTFKKPAKGGLR